MDVVCANSERLRGIIIISVLIVGVIALVSIVNRYIVLDMSIFKRLNGAGLGDLFYIGNPNVAGAYFAGICVLGLWMC